MKILYEINDDGKPTGRTQLVDDSTIETDSLKFGWENDGFNEHIWSDGKWIANNDNRPDDVLEPTQQEQLNATVLAQIAQNKADQEEFNAQALLAIANKGGN